MVEGELKRGDGSGGIEEGDGRGGMVEGDWKPGETWLSDLFLHYHTHHTL